MTAVLLVDSDNAFGSPRGDVNDAFALSALLAARAPIAAIILVASRKEVPAEENTPEAWRRVDKME